MKKTLSIPNTFFKSMLPVGFWAGVALALLRVFELFYGEERLWVPYLFFAVVAYFVVPKLTRFPIQYNFSQATEAILAFAPLLLYGFVHGLMIKFLPTNYSKDIASSEPLKGLIYLTGVMLILCCLPKCENEANTNLDKVA